MKTFPAKITGPEQLEDLLSRPTPAVVDVFKRLTGDVLILGVSGKIGPSLARMAKQASDKAGGKRRIFGVSRFTSDKEEKDLAALGIDTIRGDLLDVDFLASLPDVDNVIFMAGKKFGAAADSPLTWAINSYLPGLVAERFRRARIIAYSTGCVYPFMPVGSGGSTEETPPDARGEYAQSCLGRERLFEYASLKHQTPVAIIRLNYAVEMRYGLLVDIALKVKNKIPIDLSMGYANVIWQGDANAAALRAFDICASPVKILNLTGPETISLRRLAERFGEEFGVEPIFVNHENDTAWLSNAALCHRLFGYPEVALEQLILWTAGWIDNGLPVWDKPTHFETRDGQF